MLCQSLCFRGSHVVELRHGDRFAVMSVAIQFEKDNDSDDDDNNDRSHQVEQEKFKFGRDFHCIILYLP